MRIRTVDITPQVEAVLRAGSWTEDGTFLLPLYTAVDKVLQALGGKWNRSAKGHKFAADARAAMTEALEAGSIVDQKKTLEQFFTPPELADRVVWMADIDGTMTVLEPSAGGGALIAAIAEENSSAIITAVEIDPALCAALRAEWGLRATIMEGNFFSVLDGFQFDRAVMNPPFSGNQDIRHVKRAFDLLRPGGRLVAITSNHWTFAEERESAAFREWVGIPKGPLVGGLGYADGPGEIVGCTVEQVPAGAFKASGTNVPTLLLVLDKAQG